MIISIRNKRLKREIVFVKENLEGDIQESIDPLLIKAKPANYREFSQKINEALNAVAEQYGFSEDFLRNVSFWDKRRLFAIVKKILKAYAQRLRHEETEQFLEAYIKRELSHDQDQISASKHASTKPLPSSAEVFSIP